MSKETQLFIARTKAAKGLPITDEQARLLQEADKPKPKRERTPRPPREPKPKKPKLREFTAKDKAKYAVEQRGGELWMQKWIDWNDKAIPVGKRRVAFVRYLTMVKGYSLDDAKQRSLYCIQ